MIILHDAAGFLGISKLNGTHVSAALQSSTNVTAEGGSTFTPHPVTSPLNFLQGLVTVVFRPFPWEAHNTQARISSLESVLLLTLIITSWRRFARLPRIVAKRAYVTFAVIYVVLFVYAFSGISNFGILARERVQVLPFVLALTALPLARTRPTTGLAAAERVPATPEPVR
jgi:hypothetical protein